MEASWDTEGRRTRISRGSYSLRPWYYLISLRDTLLGKHLASFPWVIGRSISRPSEGHRLHAQRTHAKFILVAEIKTEPRDKTSLDTGQAGQ